MLEDFVGNAGAYLVTNPAWALVAVFLGGALTASNPCVLAMVPLMMSFVAGAEGGGKSSARRAFLYSLLFVLGLALTFTLLGMFAALAGRIYGEVSGAWNWIVAAICVAMGLHLAEVVTLPIPALGGRLAPKARGLLGAFLLGLLFGWVSAPCAAPLLLVLLTYLASSSSSVAWGGTLLVTYALGHSVLILLAGTSMGLAKQLIENRKATRTLGLLRRAAGIAIACIGGFFAYQGLST